MQSSKKIAFVLPSFRFGGGERVMLDVANWTAERGFAVDLIVLSPVGQYKDQVDKRIWVVPFFSPRLWVAVPQMMLYLWREQPHAVLGLDEACHILTLVARMLTGVRTRVVIRIGTMLSLLYATRPGLKDRARRRLLELLYPRADAVVAVSAGVADDLQKHFGVLKDKLVTIANPKDLAQLALAAQAPINHPWLAAGHSIPVAVGVGRFRELKGFGDMIEAFARTRAQMPCRLILIGDGRDKARLEELAQTLGVADDVFFAGYTDNPHAYVARADVFALASHWEGMPNSLVEALICGTPAVATDCSGPREVMAPATDPLLKIKKGIEHTPCGMLVPVAGIEEMSRALAELLSDKELRLRCAAAATARGRDYEKSSIIGRYVQALTQ